MPLFEKAHLIALAFMGFLHGRFRLAHLHGMLEFVRKLVLALIAETP